MRKLLLLLLLMLLMLNPMKCNYRGGNPEGTGRGALGEPENCCKRAEGLGD